VDPGLVAALKNLIEPVTRGDPESPLLWTCKSTRRLSAELKAQGHPISHTAVADLLWWQGYSLQGNRKTKEGTSHPDRNAQFEYINTRVTSEMRAGQPVISVDTKKKELVGPSRNRGTQWRKQGDAPRVNGHDFPDPAVPRAHPYGISGRTRNRGFVNVGTDHDTATFAVASIRAWWRAEGRRAYPKTQRLLITADAGGSHGARLRLWKWELQRFADAVGLPIAVSHFPPGTSKWNKIEHRLFSRISINWRGRPLTSHEVIVNTIGATTTASGAPVTAVLDTAEYPAGIKIPDEQMQQLTDDGTLTRHDWHPEWNYTLNPNTLT